MFVHRWFVLPGLMQKQPEELVEVLNANLPRDVSAIGLSDVCAIMTADDHGSIPFQWTANGDGWMRRLQPRIGANQLVLHLETFQGEENQIRLPAGLNGVASNNRIGWDLDAFRGIREVQNINDDAYRRDPISYTRLERHVVVNHLRALASKGILVPEFQKVADAALRADVGNFAVAHPYVYQAVQPRVAFFEAVLNCAYDAAHHALIGSPQDFKSALLAWFLASQPKNQDIRTLPVVHQMMGRNIEQAIWMRKDCLHLVSVGNAHLNATATRRAPLYRSVILPPNKFGIVDPETK